MQSTAAQLRTHPVPAPLRPLFPDGGLRRGSTVAVVQDGVAGTARDGAVGTGARSLTLALLAGVSADGGWGAVVAAPELSAWAAEQAGVALARLAFVPRPGPEWSAVVAALLDGLDVVALATGTEPVPPRVASRLAARARQRGAVLLVMGAWERPDLSLTTDSGRWEGVGPGRGRLRHRVSTVTSSGRGAAARPRRVQVLLPDPQGRVAVPDTTDIPATLRSVSSRLPVSPADRRAA